MSDTNRHPMIKVRSNENIVINAPTYTYTIHKPYSGMDHRDTVRYVIRACKTGQTREIPIKLKCDLRFHCKKKAGIIALAHLDIRVNNWKHYEIIIDAVSEIFKDVEKRFIRAYRKLPIDVLMKVE